MKLVAAALLFALTACSAPLTQAAFKNTAPNFDPIAFFTGHVTSWGVEENRDNQPIGIVTTSCIGTPNPAGGITMVQTLHTPGGQTQTRIWHLTQTAPTQYQATASDMAGTTAGRTMHWRWTLKTSPGNPLANVTMDQWFYHMNDGAVMIRTVVTKAGIRLLEVSEQFEKVT